MFARLGAVKIQVKEEDRSSNEGEMEWLSSYTTLDFTVVGYLIEGGSGK